MDRKPKPPTPLKRTSINSTIQDSDNEFSGNTSNISKNQEIMMKSLLRLRGEITLQLPPNHTNQHNTTINQDHNSVASGMEMSLPSTSEDERENEHHLRRLKTIDLEDVHLIVILWS